MFGYMVCVQVERVKERAIKERTIHPGRGFAKCGAYPGPPFRYTVNNLRHLQAIRSHSTPCTKQKGHPRNAIAIFTAVGNS